MDGPFGVEISKRKDVPDILAPALPASSVRAYENAGAHNLQAGAKNFGAKTAGSVAGVGAAAAGIGLLARKPKVGGLVARSPKLKPLSSFMNGADQVMNSTNRLGFKMKGAGFNLKPAHKQTVAATSIGGPVGAIAGNKDLQNTKKNPRYQYGR